MEQFKEKNRLRKMIHIHLDCYSRVGGMSLFSRHVWPAWKPVLLADPIASTIIPSTWAGESITDQALIDSMFTYQFPEQRKDMYPESLPLVAEESGNVEEWSANPLIEQLALAEVQCAIDNKFCSIFVTDLKDCLREIGFRTLDGQKLEPFFFGVAERMNVTL